MKKFLIILSLLPTLLSYSENEDDSKLGIKAKINNVSLEAVYKKNVPNEDFFDLKSYFKKGNSLKVNLKYSFEESGKEDGLGELSVINLKNKKVVNNSINNSTYTLKNNLDIKKTINNIYNIKKSSIVKYDIASAEEQIKTREIVKILNKRGEFLKKQYGEISEDNLEVDENLNKSNKILITFKKGE